MNNMRMMAAKTKRVPEILSCELARTGEAWLSTITPNQKPMLVMETVMPGGSIKGEGRKDRIGAGNRSL